MIQIKSFDPKSIKGKLYSDFKKEIYGNEVVWTYLVAKLAQNNHNVYKLITGFSPKHKHNIFLEGQPLTPYRNIEGNSYIDMALGSVELRAGTQSGIAYSAEAGSDVCFVEAKYLSDLSTKTEHSLLRNQMDRVIENLLNFESNGVYPKKVVFTILTPKIYKENPGARLYSYKFDEYARLIKENKNELIKKIELISNKEEKRFEYSKEKSYLLNRLDSLELRWITYEEIFLQINPNLQSPDITSLQDAELIWKEFN